MKTQYLTFLLFVFIVCSSPSLIAQKNINLLEKIILHKHPLMEAINYDVIVIGHLDSIYHDLSFEDYHSSSFAITVSEVLKGKVPSKHIIGRSIPLMVRYNSEGKKYVTQKSSEPEPVPIEGRDHIFFLSKGRYNQVVERATAEGEKIDLWGFETIFRTTPALQKNRINCYEYQFFSDAQPLESDSLHVARVKEMQLDNPNITLEALEANRQVFLREVVLLCKELGEYFPMIEHQKTLLAR